MRDRLASYQNAFGARTGATTCVASNYRSALRGGRCNRVPVAPFMITDTLAVCDSVESSRRARNPPAIAAARTASTIVAQIAVLWLINVGASAAVAWLRAPIPGNVLGLTLLFALLCSGIVKASWLEPAATLLVKHLAFFFIPVTIGLMGMGQLFALHGVGILVTLAVSAAGGIAICGLTSQCLINAQDPYRARLGSKPGA